MRTLVVAMMLVGAVCGSAAATDVLVPGTYGKIGVTAPPLHKLKFWCRPIATLPLPGSGDEPTIAGAKVEVFDAGGGGGGYQLYTLPASNWATIPISGPLNGYQYAAPQGPGLCYYARIQA